MNEEPHPFHIVCRQEVFFGRNCFNFSFGTLYKFQLPASLGSHLFGTEVDFIGTSLVCTKPKVWARPFDWEIKKTALDVNFRFLGRMLVDRCNDWLTECFLCSKAAKFLCRTAMLSVKLLPVKSHCETIVPIQQRLSALLFSLMQMYNTHLSPQLLLCLSTTHFFPGPRV